MKGRQAGFADLIDRAWDTCPDPGSVGARRRGSRAIPPNLSFLGSVIEELERFDLAVRPSRLD